MRKFEGGSSDPEEALEAGRHGMARRIVKPRPVPPEAVLDRPDPSRPDGIGVNAHPSMSYDEAMQALEGGTLHRAVLTERGWVSPSAPRIQRGTHA